MISFDLRLLSLAIIVRTTECAAVTPCPISREAKLCVLGGDDAGTGAAWAAARLGVPTVLVLTHRRDLGGLSE